MGFWAGMNEGLTYVLEKKAAKEAEDRAYAFKREEYQQTLLAQRQERYLERLAKKAEVEEATKAELSMGIKLGLTDRTALALQNTGQLSLFLDQYDKNKKVDPKFVEDLNLTVSRYLEEADDETISTAMINGVSTERDTTDPEESAAALAEAVYSATTPEQLDEISQKVYAPTESTTMEPFKLDFGYASGPEEAETKNIRNEIASALQVQFTDSFIVNERTGDITIAQNADRSVASLFAMLEESARGLAYGPERSRTATDAAAFVAGQVRTAINTGNIGAQAIIDNYDAVLTDPKTFAESFVQSPPPVPAGNPVPLVNVNPTTTEAEVGQLGNDLAESTFGSTVDQFGSPTQ
jgi:hypothetical protein